MRQQEVFLTIAQMLEQVTAHKQLDTAMENQLARRIEGLNTAEKWIVIEVLLTHSVYQVRMFGLRLVKRVLREKELLEKVAQLSFAVVNYKELERWYQALLSRHSIGRYGKALMKEMESRDCVDFAE